MAYFYLHVPYGRSKGPCKRPLCGVTLTVPAGERDVKRWIAWAWLRTVTVQCCVCTGCPRWINGDSTEVFFAVYAVQSTSSTIPYPGREHSKKIMDASSMRVRKAALGLALSRFKKQISIHPEIPPLDLTCGWHHPMALGPT